MDGSLYKRDEDKRWRERIEERVTLLTTGEQVQNDRLDELEETLATGDKLLRGDPEKDTEGLIGRIHALETGLRNLQAMMHMDSVGNPGIAKKVDIMWKQEERQERREDRWWKGVTPIVVAIVSAIALVLTNLDRIAGFWHQLRPPPAVALKRPAKKNSRQTGPRRLLLPPPEITPHEDEE